MALAGANGDGNFIVGAGTCFAGFVIATIFVIPGENFTHFVY
jgi:hypothetical protein